MQRRQPNGRCPTLKHMGGAVDGYTMELGSFSSALAAGQQGMAGGVARLTRAAQTLSREVDVNAIVDLKLAELQTRASAKVIDSVDESLGALLDTLA